MKSAEKLGRRKLAYQVRKFNDGNYILLTIEADGAVVLELERRLRVTEQVIKFITVRMDEEEKRLAKVKALRDSRVKRSAQPIAPQSVPAPAADAPSVSAAAETPAPEAPSASAEPEAKSAEPVAAPA